jgi:hypothetical protein
MSESERNSERDPIADEEADAAAAEAARIGGPAPDDHVADPAQRPVVEGGEGEAEGFELAEEELIDRAEHGDQKHFPDTDAPSPEEPSEATYGEPDQEIHQDE